MNICTIKTCFDLGFQSLTLVTIFLRHHTTNDKKVLAKPKTTRKIGEQCFEFSAPRILKLTSATDKMHTFFYIFQIKTTIPCFCYVMDLNLYQRPHLL